jgi:2'-5' RNA ligase
MSDSPSKRLFFALWPDPDVRNALTALQDGVPGRAVHPADLHLTLAFLGQQPESLLPTLEEVLAHLPRTEITLSLDRVGYFARNRVVWAGAHAPPPGLPELYAQIKQGLAVHAVPWRDEREYKPHVTLVRDAAAPQDLVFTPIAWRARQVALVQSQTHAEGPRYRILASRWLDQEVRVPDPGQDAPLPQAR